MKSLSLTLAASLAAVATVRASLYPLGAIPDGNPSGISLVGTYDGAPAGSTVSSLTVSLNISGGFNGDLYAYLVSPNGTLVMLMNQPGVSLNGFGASGAGMNITLTDAYTANGSIQDVTSGSVLSGNYNAAGSLANFTGSQADGNWTLYFADMSNGGGTSLVEGWNLNITAVPEPTTWALGIFGVGFIGVGGVRAYRNSRKLNFNTHSA
jgi:subtilisin-like proprotein convertase family protein